MLRHLFQKSRANINRSQIRHLEDWVDVNNLDFATLHYSVFRGVPYTGSNSVACVLGKCTFKQSNAVTGFGVNIGDHGVEDSVFVATHSIANPRMTGEASKQFAMTITDVLREQNAAREEINKEEMEKNELKAQTRVMSNEQTETQSNYKEGNNKAQKSEPSEVNLKKSQLSNKIKKNDEWLENWRQKQIIQRDLNDKKISSKTRDEYDSTDFKEINFLDLPFHKSIKEQIGFLKYQKPTASEKSLLNSVFEAHNLLATGPVAPEKSRLIFLSSLCKLTQAEKTFSPECVILFPNSDTAKEFLNDIKSYDLSTLKICVSIKGETIDEQVNAIQNGANLLIATPGRLTSLSRRGIDLKAIETVIFGGNSFFNGDMPPHRIAKLLELFSNDTQKIIIVSFVTQFFYDNIAMCFPHLVRVRI